MKCILLVLLFILCKGTIIGDAAMVSKPCFRTLHSLRSTYGSLIKESSDTYIISLPLRSRLLNSLELKFDSHAIVTPVRSSVDTCLIRSINQTFTYFICRKPKKTYPRAEFLVRGPSDRDVPNLKSAKLNGQEQCREHPLEIPADTGYIARYRRGECGRRQRDYTELIFNGQSTKPGDWPWHAAIYKERETYRCGGTLISLDIVLTAAHCVTNNKIAFDPELLTVVLGKYNFKEYDASSQEIEVFSLTVHEDFGSPKYLDNDIAILWLKKFVILNDYVQPACLWNSHIYKNLPSSRIIGSVVGWGIDKTNDLTSQLNHAYLLERSYAECVIRHPLFYSDKLTNSSKFCAGWSNGTSPCNGDSGGGFMVFVPDVPKDDSSHGPGAWFIKGIVSLTISRFNENVCDPDFYVVFTDLTKLNDWVAKHTYRILP